MYAYNRFSESAALLSEEMGIKRVKHEGSRWNPRGKVLINWGCGNANKHPFNLMGEDTVINHPSVTVVASNKLKFFETVGAAEGVNYLPAWTIDHDQALSWLNDGCTVVCRTIVDGHEGVGISIASTPEELVDAPLYTQYVKKKAEYRVHVVDGEVIDVQQKKKRRDYDGDGDNRVRNTSNGYVFCRQDIHVPDVVKQVAQDCCLVLNLDFGGVDVIYNEHYNKAYVLEVNTAPGIEGSTVPKYAEALTNLVNRIFGEI